MAASILLIDDDANFRRALQIALRLEGFTVGEAVNVDQAIEILQSRPFDCIVFNVLIACGENLRLQALVRQTMPAAGRIAYAVHPEVLGTFALQDPDAVVLDKPFTVEMLLRVAAPWLGPRRAKPVLERPPVSHRDDTVAVMAYRSATSRK